MMKTIPPNPDKVEADKLLAELRELAPSIVFSVSREIDNSYRWDGDGQDPAKDGFDAYDVTVTASAIVKGELIEGNDYLGGSYFLSDEPTGMIHGYLPQMLAEALKASPALFRSLPRATIFSAQYLLRGQI